MSESGIIVRCVNCHVDYKRGNPDQMEKGFLGYRCPSCSHVQWVLATHAPPRPQEDVQEWTVAILWSDNAPSNQDVFSLKQILSDLGELPRADILMAKFEPEFVLGRFSRLKADELVERGRALGLTIVVR